MRCPCGDDPQFHLPQEGADFISENLDTLVAKIKEHLHVGQVPCDELIDAMGVLNRSSGVAVISMQAEQHAHMHIVQDIAKGN